LAERNAAWTMILLICLLIMYQTVQSFYKVDFKIDWSLLIILFGGLIAKIISILVLKRKSL
jgi:Co/Zn/Cd efflux system component